MSSRDERIFDGVWTKAQAVACPAHHTNAMKVQRRLNETTEKGGVASRASFALDADKAVFFWHMNSRSDDVFWLSYSIAEQVDPGLAWDDVGVLTCC